MGLDAFVKCSCFKEKKTKPLPDSLLEYEDQIYLDDGYLDIHQITHLSDEDNNKLWGILQEWEAHACEHANQDLVSLQVGNWSSVRFFQQALVQLGIHNFPLLSTVLPSANGGTVPYEYTPSILKELNYFKDHVHEICSYALVNSRDQSYYNYIEAYDGDILLSSKENLVIGFNKEGLFIKSYQDGNILFQSIHCIQKVEYDNDIVKYSLTDMATSNSIIVSSTLMDSEEDIIYEVVKKHSTEEDYMVYTSLKKLFEVSHESGNSVHWA